MIAREPADAVDLQAQWSNRDLPNASTTGRAGWSAVDSDPKTSNVRPSISRSTLGPVARNGFCFNPFRSILNTAPFLATTREAAKRADIVVANETEFALLAGEGDLDEKMRGYVDATKRTIIVTLGPEGAKALTATGEAISVPAMKVTPVDTVGAGDTFVGYLAAGLEAGLSLEQSMRRAAVAASLACLKPGAQPAIPIAASNSAASA